jgi:hypothetical protein
MPYARTITFASRFLGLALAIPLALLGTGCEAPPDDTQPGSERTAAEEAPIRLVSWVASPDGSLKPVEYRLTYNDYLAMHEARRNGGSKAGKGDVAAVRQPLQIVGHHGQGCTGAGCDWGGCGDDRTTWVYNKPNGWNVAPGDASTLVVGCFGAGGGQWLGTASLTNVSVPPSFTQTWKAALTSMWTSNTDKVGLVQGGQVSVVSTFQPWTLHNLTPNTFDSIRHCSPSSSCLF